MSGHNTILLDVVPGEVRGALFENDALVEFFYYQEGAASLQEGIFLGRVKDVQKNTGMAVVDLGGGQTGFLQSRQKLPVVGTSVIVQVMSEKDGAKHHNLNRLSLLPRITSSLAVLSPSRHELHGSQRADPKKMENAMTIASSLGFYGILRSKAADVSEDVLEKALEELQKVWADIEKKAQDAEGPTLLYASTPLQRWLEENSASILVNDFALFQKIKGWNASGLMAEEVVLRSEASLFEDDIEDEWQALFEEKTPLENGGFLTFEATHLGTVIDVNAGTAGGVNPEQVHFQINVKAAEVVAYHLRLRNIRGPIVVDFITLKTAHLRKQLEQKIRSLLKKDPALVHFHGLTALGRGEFVRESHLPSVLEGQQIVKSEKALRAQASDVLRALKRNPPRLPFFLRLSPGLHAFFQEKGESLLFQLKLPSWTLEKQELRSSQGSTQESFFDIIEKRWG